MLADKDLQLKGLKNILEGNAIEKAGHNSKVEELEKQLDQERMKSNELKQGNADGILDTLEPPPVNGAVTYEDTSDMSDATEKPTPMFDYLMQQREKQLK